MPRLWQTGASELHHPAVRVADTDAVVALWERAGPTRPWNDPRKDITRKLAMQPELFLVDVDRATGRWGSG